MDDQLSKHLFSIILKCPPQMVVSGFDDLFPFINLFFINFLGGYALWYVGS